MSALERLQETVGQMGDALNGMIEQQQRLAEAITEQEVQLRFLLGIVQIKVQHHGGLLNERGEAPAELLTAWQIYQTKGGRERTLALLDDELRTQQEALRRQIEEQTHALDAARTETFDGAPADAGDADARDAPHTRPGGPFGPRRLVSIN